MKLNSDDFLTAFSAIEKWLRKESGEDRSTPFYQLIEKVSFKNRMIRRYKDDLKEFADGGFRILRNKS